MICKNCGHEIHFKDNKYYHIDRIVDTPEGIKKQIVYIIKTCSCGCYKPEPKEIRPPKVEEKYKRETFKRDFIFPENKSTLKPKQPNYKILYGILIFLIFLLFSVIYDININIVILIIFFIGVFVILPIYFIYKVRNELVSSIKILIKPIIFYGIIIFFIFTIFDALNYIGEQTSSVDSILKPAGIKEYTHEELVNNIQIINSDKDTAIIKEELLKTDNNTLKHIKSITVHNSENVECKSGDSIGCTHLEYTNDNLNYATIDVISSNYYLGNNYNDIQIINNYKKWNNYNVIPHELYNNYIIDYNNYNQLIENKICSSFEFTLYHEIGHVRNSLIGEKYDSEYNADNYANMFTKNKGEC